MTDPLDRATTAINNGQPQLATALALIDIAKSLRDIDCIDRDILHNQQRMLQGSRR